MRPSRRAGSTTRVVNLAIGYDGHREILHATRHDIAALGPEGGADPHHVARYLYNGALPNPDLIVRTSGERRLSGFMLWQSFDASLHFCDTLWPDFQRTDLLDAVKHHQAQHRTHGTCPNGPARHLPTDPSPGMRGAR
ncbi:undecaprenyl diphosphate synthase family protein [Streptomyces sp. NBC_00285]|uniref:undecaprenyl diphosphate synthase family protein n=1 Tax=Streptomyces sp. NBC_00285 TaxID=2975700 RepID=UPI002E2A17FD|nr:undecaprenyl diphosphate synthase family protein [Streptomyces sp. NBC_00285]